MTPEAFPDAPRFTVVSFHAHPDDEALLVGGTLARAASEGHRVVIVVATAGEAGLARRGAAGDDLGARRRRELKASAAAIGAARVAVLGYPDSGYDVDAPPSVDRSRPTFATADVDTAADRLASILREERADVLTTYDPSGGYGHPDHVQVHRVGAVAARLAGTPVVLEATVDRQLLLRMARLVGLVGRVARVPAMPDLTMAYTGRDDLTHVVDVRHHLEAKRRALRAHVSQAGADDGVRTLALLLRLPRPLARLVLGREWFREVGRTPAGQPLDDIFASLRPAARASVTRQ